MPPRLARELLLRGGWPTAVSLLALIPFAGGLSLTNTFYVRDLAMYFWPRQVWHWQSVHARDWPLWDPYAAGGQSAVADALNQFFLIPVTLIRLLLPPVIGFNIWIAAPLPTLAVGAWIWLSRRVSPAAAFVGAAVASTAGPIVSTGNFPNFSWTVALAPWILWSVDRLCEAPTIARFAAVAACVGLQAVAGEPVTFSASCALAVAYAALALPITTWREWRVRLLTTLAGVATGFLLSAIQMVPLLLAVRRSTRATDIDETFWSLHPLMLLETLIPHLFGHVYQASLETFPWITTLNSGREPLLYSLYAGLGACVLATIAESGAPARRWHMFWWAVFAIALVSALGKYTFVYPALERALPILETFRFPVKYFVFSVLALAALAARGANAVLTHSRAAVAMKRPSGTILLLGALGVTTAISGVAGVLGAEWIASLWLATGRASGVDDPAAGARWLMQAGAPLWLRLSLLATVLLALIAVVWRRHRLAPIAAWTICTVAVVDPVSVNHDIHPTMPAALLGPPEWRAATLDHPHDRVYVGGRLRKRSTEERTGSAGEFERIDAPNRFPVPLEWNVQEAITRVSIQFCPMPAAWGIRELISYDLPQLWPREYTTMLHAFRNAPSEDRLRFLRRTGTRYCFLQEPPSPGAPPLTAPALSEPMALYECHDDPRRVYITESAIVEPDLSRQLDLMLSARHDPSAAALLEHEPPAPAGDRGPAASRPAALVVRERNTELVVKAAVGPAGGYLNVLDSYDPFWRVEVDGRPAELLRANGVFRAVRLAPGSHEVRFRYRPTHFYVGAGVTGATAAILLLGCWLASVRRPRGAQDDPRVT